MFRRTRPAAGANLREVPSTSSSSTAGISSRRPHRTGSSRRCVARWRRPAVHRDGLPLTLWVIDLNVDPARLASFERDLDDDERHRAARFAFERHRRRFIVRRSARRRILAALTGASPRDVACLEGPTGKPRLAGGGPGFSCSHSGDVAVLLAARDERVGVDVETLDDSRVDVAALSGFVDPLAIAEVAALPAGGTRVTAFFRWWTRVEALGKATGTGITQWPDAVLPASLGVEAELEWPPLGGAGPRWRLRTFRLASSHLVTVVTAADAGDRADAPVVIHVPDDLGTIPLPGGSAPGAVEASAA
ncbi:MAG: 4'-phosphopantetheinyl transferase superfamily protein [Betaproteobacteria bacterium]|nr:4'-phosphopantetheinyl transferase superfamily protein [Betaproteobacteria bacterium]